MSKVATAVIPVAGLGTRLYPATKAIPQALLPVMTPDGRMKPLIHLLVAEAVEAGVDTIVIVTHPDQKGLIARYFHEPVESSDAHPQLGSESWHEELAAVGSRLFFVAQEPVEGLGHAVLCARDYCRRGPVLILMGNSIFRAHPGCPPCSRQLVQYYHKYQRSVIGVTTEETPHSFPLAVVPGKPLDEFGAAHAVESLILRAGETVAEPMPFHFFGMSVLTPPIFDILDYNVRNDIRSHGEIQFGDALDTLVLLEGIVACLMEGERWALNTPESWATVMAHTLLDSPYRETVREIVSRWQ